MKYNLSDIELQNLRKYLKQSSDSVSYIKVTVILMLDMQKGIEEIEEVLGIDGSTIYRYAERYQLDGLEKYLETNYKGYFGELSCVQISLLRKDLKNRLYTTSKEVVDLIEQSFNITYSKEGVV